MSTETRYTVVDASANQTLPVINTVPNPVEGPTGFSGTGEYYSAGYTGYNWITGPTGPDQYAECVMISHEICVNNGCTGKTGCICPSESQ